MLIAFPLALSPVGVAGSFLFIYFSRSLHTGLQRWLYWLTFPSATYKSPLCCLLAWFVMYCQCDNYFDRGEMLPHCGFDLSKSWHLQQGGSTRGHCAKWNKAGGQMLLFSSVHGSYKGTSGRKSIKCDYKRPSSRRRRGWRGLLGSGYQNAGQLK